MPPSEPVLLLDGMSLLFRAFFALPPMTTSRGEPTGGLYGLSSLLLKLLREQRPSALALALDAPGGTFRHAAFTPYKAHRERAPSPLASQLRRLPELIEALGVPAHAVPGFEADDVLATLARRCREAGQPALVVTGDTDLLQVARGPVAVWFVGRRQRDAVLYDEAGVRERYGIAPEQIPSYKALVGDKSDNLPGIPGVGKKTASAWVSEHGDVAGILAHAGELKPERLREAVRERAAELPLYEELATVRDDLDLAEPCWAPLADPKRLAAWFEALEFKSLLPRLEAWTTYEPH